MKDPEPKTEDLEPVAAATGDGGDVPAPDESAAEVEAPGAETGTDPGDAALLDEIERELERELEVDEAQGTGESLDEELLALREEFDGLNDRHLRLAAEFNNYRRRVEAERLDVWSRAQAELVRKLADVLDDLQRVAGLDLGNASVEAIMEGIDLVERKFVRVLTDAGVEVLDPTGEAFDPETMEAMMRAVAESEEEDDRVAQVFQKGYVLDGILIRPARVSVLKHG